QALPDTDATKRRSQRRSTSGQRKRRLFVLRLQCAECAVKQAVLLSTCCYIQRCVRSDEDSDHFRHGVDEDALPSNTEERKIRLAWIYEPCLITITGDFQSGAEPQVRCICRSHGTHPCGGDDLSAFGGALVRQQKTEPPIVAQRDI